MDMKSKNQIIQKKNDNEHGKHVHQLSTTLIPNASKASPLIVVMAKIKDIDKWWSGGY